MSGNDVFQTIGAAAGVLAFAWNVFLMRAGTFTDETLRRTIEGHGKDMLSMVEKMEGFMKREQGGQ